MSPINPTTSIMELSIAGVHARFAQGLLTCTELTQRLLQRIERYDKQGPCLNALLTVSPYALATARHKDHEYQRNPTAVGPLHGIPVIVKDNYNTMDLPTTGGSVVLAQSRPPQDCFVVQQLRKAGAIILAKANLTELALGGTTISSLGGQTCNPYDLLRTPGGSSGGTAAAIAANFGIVGTGSDTGQSTRSPASACNIVGLRPTRGLISRSGILPISITQDGAGPLSRSVADAARMLDVMAGYDPDDPITAFGWRQKPTSYVSSLDRDGLRGARLGLLSDFLGTAAVHTEVNAVVHTAVQLLEQCGATVVPLTIPHLDTLTADIGVERFEFCQAFNHYLARLGPDAPVKNLREFLADGRRGQYAAIRERLARGVADGDLTVSPDGLDALARYYATVVQGLSIQARDGANREALEAIVDCDMAAWDALAQSLGKPLVRALGATPRPIPAYNSNGLGIMPIQPLAKEATELVNEGFRAVKLRLGRPEARDDLEALRARLNCPARPCQMTRLARVELMAAARGFGHHCVRRVLVDLETGKRVGDKKNVHGVPGALKRGLAMLRYAAGSWMAATRGRRSAGHPDAGRRAFNRTSARRRISPGQRAPTRRPPDCRPPKLQT